MRAGSIVPEGFSRIGQNFSTTAVQLTPHDEFCTRTWFSFFFAPYFGFPAGKPSGITIPLTSIITVLLFTERKRKPGGGRKHDSAASYEIQVKEILGSALEEFQNN